MNTPYIDIHTHFPHSGNNVLSIQSVRFGETPGPDASFVSAGLHPWYLDQLDRKTARDWLENQARRPEVVAVGEAGLDQLRGAAADIQLQAFEWCIEVSELFEKPLIVHCVRAYEAVLAVKKRLKPAQPWIIHGFRKNEITARRLLDAGCILSFGAALLQPQPTIRAAFAATPDDCFFMETDDRPMHVREIYQAASEVRQEAEDILAQQMRSNFQRIFKRLL